MDDVGLGTVVRLLRQKRGWRQVDLAIAARVSAGVIGLLERGQAEHVSLPALRRVAGALGVRLAWNAGYRGPELDRLRDADHAAVAELMVRLLSPLGWLVRAEVSYNRYGDRGRIDLLAFHPPTATLLLIEIKTLVADVQDLLGSVDVKERVGPVVGRAAGYHPRSVVSALTVVDTTTNRRRIDAHEGLFSRFPIRGRQARAWLRKPEPDCPGLLFFVKLPDRNHSAVMRAGRQRIRLRRAGGSSGLPAHVPPEAISRG